MEVQAEQADGLLDRDRRDPKGRELLTQLMIKRFVTAPSGPGPPAATKLNA